MADNSAIEWTDATWNPVTGCSIVSPGCTNCYAMRLAGTRLKHIPSRAGLTRLTKAGPVWNGKVRFNEEWLDQPLRWKRPRRIFVCAHGDLFAEKVPSQWIDKVFAVMALAPQHTFQVLTKRAKRMREYFSNTRPMQVIDAAHVILKARSETDIRAISFNYLGWPLPNVWLGVSAERQQEADERIPLLLQTPAAIRFISAEPLLGWIDLRPLSCGTNALTSSTGPNLDWVIAGGESGPKARPMLKEWATFLRDQCLREAEIPFFFKQWGEWTPGENVERTRGICQGATWFDDRWIFEKVYLAQTDGHVDDEPDLYRIGKKAAGRHLDGELHSAFPGAGQ